MGQSGNYAKAEDLLNYATNSDVSNLRKDISELKSRPVLPTDFNSNTVITDLKDLKTKQLNSSVEYIALAKDVSDLKKNTLVCTDDSCLLPDNVTQLEISNGIFLRNIDNNLCLYNNNIYKNMVCVDKVTGNIVPVSSIKSIPAPVQFTTSAPATSAPTTSAPTTSAPATSAPATSAPTTSAPTTSAPTTSAPVQYVISTSVPTPLPTTTLAPFVTTAPIL
jgi:cell division septation protein DedD